VVLDAVVIRPPYRVEDCAAGQGGGGALGRVRKVVSTVLSLSFWILWVGGRGLIDWVVA